jgi:hypothetical protein
MLTWRSDIQLLQRLRAAQRERAGGTSSLEECVRGIHHILGPKNRSLDSLPTQRDFLPGRRTNG